MSSDNSPSGAPPAEAGSEDRWPMRIRLRRRPVRSGRWEAEYWSVAAVESDRAGAPARVSCAGRPEADADGEIYTWRGLWLELHRDERAAYRFNLGSAEPKLFVNCNADESGRMEPKLITASQDIAASYMDGGEEDVFSVAMPAAIQCWIEAFIARHGEPEIQLGKGRHRQHGGRGKREEGDA